MIKNDFIEIGRTTCYFIDYSLMQIMTGVIIGYNNITNLAEIRYKTKKQEYVDIYRQRDSFWFILEESYLSLIEYLETKSMYNLRVMNLSDQLDGEKTVLTTPTEVGDRYTIYLNGLRQNREDYIINDEDLTITMVIDYIPTKDDILTIEYWSKE